MNNNNFVMKNHYSTHLSNDWGKLRDAYSLASSIDTIQSIGTGHINDTFRVTEKDSSWILQRINHVVFNNPQLLQANFDKVSLHLASTDFPLAIQNVKHTQAQQSLIQCNDRYWRLLEEITDCHSPETADSAEIAYQAAAGFGHLDRALMTLPVTQIDPVIPQFHDLSLRLKQLQQSIVGNAKNRVKTCTNELLTVEAFQSLAEWLPKAQQRQQITLRVTHNDTKISNVLLCNQTNKITAVIDWDTIMPGYWLLDFGDMVRSFTPNTKEDSSDNSSPEIRWEILQGLTEGYLSACGDHLSKFEREHLLIGAEIIIFMIGVRFLTDYLNGDVYFKTQYETQNLRRAQTQFALVKHLRNNRDLWEKKLHLG